MERLTEKHYLAEDHYMKCSEDCNVDIDCVDCPAFDKLIERLAAYEDTGLTPDEIKAPFTEGTVIKLAAQALGVDSDRLRELTEADKAGRCVVLPCKVYDTVWRIVRDKDPHITRDEVRDMYFADDMTLCIELVGGRMIFAERFSENAFLTREEAERAMEGKKDG